MKVETHSCDNCGAKFEDPKEKPWEQEFPIHYNSFGFTVSPSSWAGGGNEPPITKYGLDLGDLCNKCHEKGKNILKELFPHAKEVPKVESQ